MGLVLGQLNYINSLPIIHGLKEGIVKNDNRILLLSPTEINQRIEKEIDVGSASSIEYALHPRKYIILPNLSITSKKEALSVLLFTEIPINLLTGKIISVPTTSATSVALLQIILAEKYGITNVKLQVTEPDVRKMLAKNNAALLIGDEALRARELEIVPFVYDLGEVWHKMTGEKMIFSLWLARREVVKEKPKELAQCLQTLIESKNYGLTHLEVLAEFYSRSRDFSPEFLLYYWKKMEYDFDVTYLKSLSTFYNYALKLKLISSLPRFNFFGQFV